MSGTEVPTPEPRCDHTCLLDDGHVERGEAHQYGYVLGWASGEGTAPQPDTHPETQRVWVDGLLIDAVVIYREWARYTRNAALKAEAQPWPEGTLPGTAPQPPSEVLWEGQTEPMLTDETPAHSNLYQLPFTPGTRVRVVAADGAPQEADHGR